MHVTPSTRTVVVGGLLPHENMCYLCMSFRFARLCMSVFFQPLLCAQQHTELESNAKSLFAPVDRNYSLFLLNACVTQCVMVL